MAIVVFVPAQFKAAYPEFTSTPDARTQVMFGIAEQSLMDNTSGSPVMDIGYRTQLFYMLVAHLLTIFGSAPPSGGNSRPPGRLSSATEGTVSTSFEYTIPPGSAMAAWYLQTPYGALYWTATAQFRSILYFVAGNSGVGFARNFIAVGGPCGVVGLPTPTLETGPILYTDNISTPMMVYVGFAERIVRIDYSVSPPLPQTALSGDWANRTTLDYN